MKRFFGLGVARFFAIAVCVILAAGVCRAIEPKYPNTAPPAPARLPTPGGGFQFGNPPAGSGAYNDPFHRASEAGSGAASSAVNPLPNSALRPGYPYGNGNGPYSTYGIFPYGYYPPGTTPYGSGYGPTTGSTSLNPSTGGNSAIGNPYPGYRYPTLGNEYPGFSQPPANAIGPASGNLNQFANGLGRGGNPGPGNNVIGGANGTGIVGGTAALKPNAPVGGNAMRLAWQFIAYGDSDFRNQRYNDAFDRYRSATRESPTLGEAWFRAGFALAALGNYQQSAAAIRRGLEEKPSWTDSYFHLTDLYGGAANQKQALLDKITKASDAQPSNGDLAFVAGVHLFWDGKAVPAARYFRRAAQIAGTDAGVRTFLQ